MISSRQEYDKVQEELRCLEDWLARLQQDHPFPTKGLTKAGVRKMISRLHEELARFEGTGSLREMVLSNPNPEREAAELRDWLSASAKALRKAWDNEGDADYDCH